MLTTLLRKSWWKNESGSATVEFVMWLPIMAFLLTLTTDATTLMHQQQNLYNAARDASRQVALGQKTQEQAEEALLARFATDALQVIVEQENGFVTTTVSVPYSEYARVSGVFDGNLEARVSMWVENNEA